MTDRYRPRTDHRHLLSVALCDYHYRNHDHSNDTVGNPPPTCERGRHVWNAGHVEIIECACGRHDSWRFIRNYDDAAPAT